MKVGVLGVTPLGVHHPGLQTSDRAGQGNTGQPGCQETAPIEGWTPADHVGVISGSPMCPCDVGRGGRE